MISLKISDYLKNQDKKETKYTKLTPYKKLYNIGNVICVVGFYLIQNNERVNISLKEMEKLFKTRKIRVIDVKFDVKHLVVAEEYEHGFSKHGYIAFNDTVNPLLIAINNHPNYSKDRLKSYTWKFIDLPEYFKENPITNLEYIDYKYANSLMLENDFIPNRVNRNLKVVVNNYLGSINVSL